MGQIGLYSSLIACHCHQVDVNGVLIMGKKSLTVEENNG